MSFRKEQVHTFMFYFFLLLKERTITMRIKILADSTCDLSEALVAANDITIVPLTVVKDDQQFKDGVDIVPADMHLDAWLHAL